MKTNKTSLIVFVLLLVASCTDSYTSTEKNEQKREVPIALDIAPGNLGSIELTEIDEVVLKAGDSSYIEVIGCKTSELKTVLTPKRLMIEKTKEIAKKDVTIVLHYRKLDELVFTNVGAIRGEINQASDDLMVEAINVGDFSVNVNCTKLNFTALNVGDINLKGKINHNICSMSNVASIDFTKAITKKLNLDAENIADCGLYCSDSLVISLSNCTSLTILGNPTSITKDLSNVLSSSFD